MTTPELTPWLGLAQMSELVRDQTNVRLLDIRTTACAVAAVGGPLGGFVNPLFGMLAAAVGVDLVFAGLTDTRGMAMAFARLPCNRPATCDVSPMVSALSNGRAPAGIGRAPATFATAPRTYTP